jgi:hypothetical protein
VTEIAPTELAPAALPASDLGARIVHGVLASIALLCLVTLGWRGVSKLDGAVLADLVARHRPAVIGVPVAVAVATSVVGGFGLSTGDFACDWSAWKPMAPVRPWFAGSPSS